MRQALPDGWSEIDSTRIDEPGSVDSHPDPYARQSGCASRPEAGIKVVSFDRRRRNLERATTVIRLPSYEQVAQDPVLYAHASRVFHLETNPGNARALVQRHGDRGYGLIHRPFR